MYLQSYKLFYLLFCCSVYNSQSHIFYKCGSKKIWGKHLNWQLWFRQTKKRSILSSSFVTGFAAQNTKAYSKLCRSQYHTPMCPRRSNIILRTFCRTVYRTRSGTARQSFLILQMHATRPNSHFNRHLFFWPFSRNDHFL